MAPPGRPNMTSTPCISRLLMSACAPVSSIVASSVSLSVTAWVGSGIGSGPEIETTPRLGGRKARASVGRALTLRVPECRAACGGSTSWSAHSDMSSASPQPGRGEAPGPHHLVRVVEAGRRYPSAGGPDPIEQRPGAAVRVARVPGGSADEKASPAADDLAWIPSSVGAAGRTGTLDAEQPALGRGLENVALRSGRGRGFPALRARAAGRRERCGRLPPPHGAAGPRSR